MKWTKTTQRAYLAGLIDGEGYVGAIRRLPNAKNKGTTPKYTIRVSIVMCDERPIRMLADFCGHPHLVGVRDRKAKPNHSRTFFFDLENERAAWLLRQLMPFLVVKKDQARMCLQLAALKTFSRNHRTRATKTYGRAMSDEFITKCDDLYVAMRRRPNEARGAIKCV